MGATCGACICSHPGSKALRDNDSDYGSMMTPKVPEDPTTNQTEAPVPVLQQQSLEDSHIKMFELLPVAPARPENKVVASSTEDGDSQVQLAPSGPAFASTATSSAGSRANGGSGGASSSSWHPGAPDPLFAQQPMPEASSPSTKRPSWWSAKKTDPLSEDQLHPLCTSASRSTIFRSVPSGLRLHKMGSKMLGRSSPTPDSSWDVSGDIKPWHRAAPSGNSNSPQDYRWLEAVLESLARNQAASLGCTDTATGKGFIPVFFVLGACPNLFCGMQVVMYSVSGDGEVDFWWVKPRQGAVAVEPNTLSRHAKGPYKNDPGRSKPFYKPLADLFIQEQIIGGTRFGIEQADTFSRAFLEQASDSGVTRQYISLIWQEDWSSNPFTSRKYIKGKIVYQKDPQSLEFFARQYSIVNGSFTIFEYEDKPFGSVLPGDDIKELRAE